MSLKPALTALLAGVLWLGGCATRAPSVPPTAEAPDAAQGERGDSWREIERGLASWYGGKFHGRRTASGETFDRNALTAAHKTLPFGALVRVRHAGTGKEVVVRITDRGPFVKGRIIDLSQAAAAAIGLTRAGVAPVVVFAP